MSQHTSTKSTKQLHNEPTHLNQIFYKQLHNKPTHLNQIFYKQLHKEPTHLTKSIKQLHNKPTHLNQIYKAAPQWANTPQPNLLSSSTMSQHTSTKSTKQLHNEPTHLNQIFYKQLHNEPHTWTKSAPQLHDTDYLFLSDRKGYECGYVWRRTTLITNIKKPSVTQDQNTRVTENSIIHVERSEKSVNTRDWASLSIWVTEFSVTLVLWYCVTLGFSNSATSRAKYLFTSETGTNLQVSYIITLFLGLSHLPNETSTLYMTFPPLNELCHFTIELFIFVMSMRRRIGFNGGAPTTVFVIAIQYQISTTTKFVFKQRVSRCK
jgi:hypothetical protein